MELPDLPDGWRLKSLIEDEGTWKAYVYSDYEWCCAGGTSPRYAMLDAIRRIEDDAVHVNMTGGKFKADTIDVLSVLGLGQPVRREPFKRRV